MCYRTIVLTVILHRCKTLTLTPTPEDRLRASQNKMLVIPIRQLRRQHAGFFRRTSWFNSGWFQWDSWRTKWHCVRLFTMFFRLPPPFIMSPLLQAIHRCPDSPNQAERYHNLRLYPSLTRHFSGLRVRQLSYRIFEPKKEVKWDWRHLHC